MDKKYDYTPVMTGAMIGSICSELGDMPNIEMHTFGGKFMWDTIEEVDGWKVQVNKITGHARILDPDDIRKAWGSEKIMIEKLRRYKKKNFLEYGDIIGVHRYGILYDHYAVYVGNNEVIHYASEDGDFGGQISIHRAHMSEFLGNDRRFFVLNFPDQYGYPSKINVPYSSASAIGLNKIRYILNSKKYHLYSPEETVKRAENRIGEKEYGLISNNCEHFAIWCKTGISESHQVNDILDAMSPIEMIINCR